MHLLTVPHCLFCPGLIVPAVGGPGWHAMKAVRLAVLVHTMVVQCSQMHSDYLLRHVH